MDSDLDEAVSGQSVTLTLTDEIDISRGDVIATSETPPEISDQFDTTIIWLSEEPMLPGRSYRMKTSSRLVSATVNARVDSCGNKSRACFHSVGTSGKHWLL